MIVNGGSVRIGGRAGAVGREDVRGEPALVDRALDVAAACRPSGSSRHRRPLRNRNGPLVQRTNGSWYHLLVRRRGRSVIATAGLRRPLDALSGVSRHGSRATFTPAVPRGSHHPALAPGPVPTLLLSVVCREGGSVARAARPPRPRSRPAGPTPSLARMCSMCDPTVRGAIPRSPAISALRPPVATSRATSNSRPVSGAQTSSSGRRARPARTAARARAASGGLSIRSAMADRLARDPDGIGRAVRAEVGGRKVREGADVLPDAPSGGPARHGRLETGPGADARPGGEMQETGRVVDRGTRARDVPLPQPSRDLVDPRLGGTEVAATGCAPACRSPGTGRGRRRRRPRTRPPGPPCSGRAIHAGRRPAGGPRRVPTGPATAAAARASIRPPPEPPRGSQWRAPGRPAPWRRSPARAGR